QQEGERGFQRDDDRRDRSRSRPAVSTGAAFAGSTDLAGAGVGIEPRFGEGAGVDLFRVYEGETECWTAGANRYRAGNLGRRDQADAGAASPGGASCPSIQPAAIL